MDDNNFNDKKFSLEDFKPMHIGDLLRSAREKKGVELRLISQKTRINFKILENIENNNIPELPNKTYVKGFVQTYAKEIDLDPELAVRCLEYSYSCHEQKKAEPVKTKQKNSNKKSTPKVEEKIELSEEQKSEQKAQLQINFNQKITAISASVVAVIIISIWLASGTSEPRKDTTQQPQKMEKPEIAVNTTTQVTPTVDPEPTIAPEPTVAPTPVATATPVPTPITKISKKQKIEMYPEVEFRPITSKVPLFSVIPNAPENNDNTLLPRNIKNAMVEDQQNIYINAVDGDTWISYKKDDSPVRNFILKEGRTLLIRGEEVLIFLGNVNSTKIFYNNQLIDANSKSGVKSLIFPDENKNNYYIPLFARDKNGVSYSAPEYIKAREESLEEKND